MTSTSRGGGRVAREMFQAPKRSPFAVYYQRIARTTPKFGLSHFYKKWLWHRSDLWDQVQVSYVATRACSRLWCARLWPDGSASTAAAAIDAEAQLAQEDED